MTLCPYLESYTNEQFASSQLKRIFEKLTALAADSPAACDKIRPTTAPTE
ncbi:hypothetical protein [Haloarcula amylovorans]|nr:hypothetical protein [Halomicroarcula amylolytica]